MREEWAHIFSVYWRMLAADAQRRGGGTIQSNEDKIIQKILERQITSQSTFLTAVKLFVLPLCNSVFYNEKQFV